LGSAQCISERNGGEGLSSADHPAQRSACELDERFGLRYAITIPTFKETHAEVTINVLNLLNLLNSDWGWQYFGAFPGNTGIGYGGIDPATGK
jgi:hypothetical protein